MPNPAPKIDRRGYAEIVNRTEQLAQRYADWQPDPSGRPDGGTALIRIFARLTELVLERVNRVPEKNLLAFLDMLGTQILPPQPARVPLTFHISAGSTSDALVPERTQVAATPAPGDTSPIVFETERDLVVTRAELAAVFSREPGRDRFGGDYIAAASGVADMVFPIFSGDYATAHRLYLGNRHQFELPAASKDITIRFTPAEGSVAWLSAVAWAYWNGTTYTPLTGDATGGPRQAGSTWEIRLPNLPTVPAAAPNPPSGATAPALISSWLCGTLLMSLPRNPQIDWLATGAPRAPWRPNLRPDAVLADASVQSLDQIIYPFGKDTRGTIFYIASAEAFAATNSPLNIAVTLDPASAADPDRSVRAAGDLVLVWEYWNATTWQELGRSTPFAAATEATTQAFADETRAFTRDGNITLICPTDWRTQTLAGQERLWLRARIAAGSYSTLAGYRPPAVQSVTLSYGALPRISAIQTSIHVAEKNLPADVAFTNQLTVDLSKDFFPFGEKPKFNDTFYLASDRALLKPGALVTLTITLTNPANAKLNPPPAVPNNVTLAWEYWDGVRWQDLKAADQSTAFTKDKAQVTFTCPPAIPVEINGQSRAWIRVRLASGDYGTEAHYIVKDAAAGSYQLVPANFQPPSIKTLAIDYDYTSPFEAPDYTLAENDFTIEDFSAAAKTLDNPATAADEDRAFLPFKPMSGDPQPALYMAFRRPGNPKDYASRPVTLYLDVADALYSEAALEDRAPAEPAGVLWAYWNGERWNQLGTRDETQAFTRRGLVTFVSPADIQPQRDFGTSEALVWLRAVWERGEYLSPPELRRVLTNTIWATHTLTIQNEVLGSGTGEPNQLFRTTKAPVLPGQAVELREAAQPSADELVAIEDEEGADALTLIPGPGGQPSEIWVRWHEVADFYGSGPRSRHYTLDRLTGEVRFGDGQQGMLVPPGRGNVRMPHYQTGGGAEGNRPARSITQLKTTVPLVDSVINLVPSSGGVAQEDLSAALSRGPRALRHRDRAVAIADFEDLAFQASPDVALVRGIAAQDSASAGVVLLLIVPRGGDTKPIPSLELLARVQDYIAARLAPTVDLLVRGPDWLMVTVSVEVVPLVPEAATDVQTAVMAQLSAFLHPLTGGLDGTGWAFGRKPYRSDLYALIERTPGVSYVRRLAVEEQPDENVARPERFLVYSGDHQIVMSGDTDLTGV